MTANVRRYFEPAKEIMSAIRMYFLPLLFFSNYSNRFGNLAARLIGFCFLFVTALAAADGYWVTAAAPFYERTSHTATLLPNGKVLIVGGFKEGVSELSSAELYDPSTNSWIAAQPLVNRRAFHTATLLLNGKVLITGGSYIGTTRSVTISSAELYDPATDTWAAAKPLIHPRAGHTATLLTNGKVLVAGGSESNSWLSSAELYDPLTDNWSSAESLASGRSHHTATLMPNGKVLVVGGSSDTDLYSAELYDPLADRWTAAGPLVKQDPGKYPTYARTHHTATPLVNGKVLIAGGGGYAGLYPEAELYDSANNTWIAAGVLTTLRGEHTATLLPNGKVLFAGSVNLDPAVYETGLNSAEQYDPATNSWAATGSLAIARGDHTATLLNNGKVLVVGGRSGKPMNPLASAELYNLELSLSLCSTGSWNRDASARAWRHGYLLSSCIENAGK